MSWTSETNIKGPPGPPGADGVDGVDGVDGAPGMPGADGAPGAKGDKGDKGDTGDTGPQGPQGIPGTGGGTGEDDVVEFADLASFPATGTAGVIYVAKDSNKIYRWDAPFAGITAVTWDPATVTAVTLSGGNLVATNTGTTSADQGAKVASAAGKTSGKYYFEYATTLAGGLSPNNAVGVGTTASTYTNMGNSATAGVMCYKQGGNIWANGSNSGSSVGTQAAPKTYGVAVDLDNRRMWFRVAPSGNWNGSGTADPATNVGGITIPAGTMVPFVTFGGATGTANVEITANFGATAFSGAVPSGFTSGWPVSYATWDAATVTAVTLSGGDLVATNTGTTSADQGARVAAASGKTAGKYYFEVTITRPPTVIGSNVTVGIGTTSSTYTNMGNNATIGAVAYTSGAVWAGGSSVAGINIGSVATTDTIGIAVDLDNRKIWFRKNSGSWNAGISGADPVTNAGGATIPAGTMVPFVMFGGTSGVAGIVRTANFGASAFSGAVPSGFTSGWTA